jgi:GNAT superfamily N-acetyltransferase
MDIRLAQPSDAPDISRLISQLTRFFTVDTKGAGAESFLSGLEPSAISRLVTAPNFRYHVGIDGDEVVGVVAIRDNFHLFHLFVVESLHGQGRGTLLWHYAKAAAIDAGNPGRFTLNSTVFGVPVYETFGFKAVGPKAETRGIAFVPMLLDQTA